MWWIKCAFEIHLGLMPFWSGFSLIKERLTCWPVRNSVPDPPVLTTVTILGPAKDDALAFLGWLKGWRRFRSTMYRETFDIWMAAPTNWVEAIAMSLIFPHPIPMASWTLVGSQPWTRRASWEPEKRQFNSGWNVMHLKKIEDFFYISIWNMHNIDRKTIFLLFC